VILVGLVLKAAASALGFYHLVYSEIYAHLI
jgi:hypothetical protein